MATSQRCGLSSRSRACLFVSCADMTSHSTSSSVLRRPGHPALSYTLHHPSTPTNHLALLAHPLGRLGGSQRDPLILALTQMLVGEGWTVCTYDARGAGESEGSASWT